MAQFAADGVPTIDGCRPAVLRLMTDGKERQLRDIVHGVASVLELPGDVVAQKISSGQGRLENRVGWACSSFARAGLLHRPSRGMYRISEDGRTVDQRNLTEYSEEEMKEWATWRAYQDEVGERKVRQRLESATELAGDVTAQSPSSLEIEADPLSVVSDSVDELNDAVETELRGALQNASPEFFEKAVLEVLWAMGYGGGMARSSTSGSPMTEALMG